MMSFDLALNKGDLQVGPDGEMSQIRNTSKVVQDVLKVIHMPVGSNPFFPRLGSTITTDNIGQISNQQFMQTRAAASLTQSIQTIQTIQRNQALTQSLTPEEIITNILQLDVQLDKDPRQIDISIIIQTEALTTVTIPSFTLSTNIL